MAKIVCKQCGETVEKRMGTQFCSPKCKSSYWNDISKSVNVKPSEKENSKRMSDEKTGLLNVSNETSIPNKEIEVEVDIPNPDIEKFTKEKSLLIVENNRLAAQKSSIEGRIIAFDSSNRLTLALAGGMAGMAIVENDKEKSSPILAGGLGALIGLKIGSYLDKASKKTNELGKAKLVQELQIINTRISVMDNKISEAEKRIATTPKTTKRKALRPNPAYREYIQRLQAQEAAKVECMKKKENEKMIKREVKEQNKPLGKIISSRQLANMSFNALNFQDKWKDFLGQPAIDFLMVIHGKPGGGKSTFLIQLANYLASDFGEALYVSGEEGFSLTLRDKVINSNALSESLSFADLHSLGEIEKEVPQGKYNFIVLDSLNNLEIDAAGLQHLKDHFPSSAIIAIAQSTKDGKMRGSNVIIHDCDIEIAVHEGIATSIKNRFYKTGEAFEIFKAAEETNKEPPKVILPRNVIQ